MFNYAVVIPARYQSSRFPGKPLAEICGLPMIIRTYQQCLKACPQDKIYVASDDERIRKSCEMHDINFLMTSSNCLTGTDRVAECIDHIDAEVFINVQGDEPIFNPADLKILVKAAECFPDEILNGYCLIKEEETFRNANVPKVVARPDGRLLYMSRAAIPTTKSQKFEIAYRQVCAYSFPRKALIEFSKQPHKTPLEEVEDIEIIRFLELGWEVRMIKMSDESIAVDIPEDIKKVENAIHLSKLQKQ